MKIAKQIDEVAATSAVAVVRAALERAKADKNNVVINLSESRALERAAKVDAESLKVGWLACHL